MTVSWIFFAAVPVLESLRIYFLAREVRRLAIQKGEAPTNWVLSTIFLWISAELLVVVVWWWVNEGRWMVAGIFLAIMIARLLFSLLKKNLESRPDVSMEQKIGQIGTHGDSEE